MAIPQKVSLLLCLLVTGGLGQTSYNPYPQPNPEQQIEKNLLTCISADTQDLQSQIRLTIRPLNKSPISRFGHLGPGFSQLLGRDEGRRRQDWTINGMLLASQKVQKAGTYRIAIFEGGRTFGECKAPALGNVIDTTRRNPFGIPGLSGYGPYSPLALGANPLASAYGNRGQYGQYGPYGPYGPYGQYGQQQPHVPTGIISNPVVLSTGTTMYSGIVRRMSYFRLLGSSIAVCQGILNGKCIGLIPYCCSITRDLLPANKVYVDPAQQRVPTKPSNSFGNSGGLIGTGLAGGLATGGSLGGLPGQGSIPGQGVKGLGGVGTGTLGGVGTNGIRTDDNLGDLF